MKRALILLPMLCLILAIVPRIVYGQDSSLVTEPSAEYQFGEQLRFGLSANNASEVESISLFLQPVLSTNVYEVDVPLESSETINVVVTVPVDLIKLRPFQKVKVGWELQTTNGVKRVLPEDLSYEDDRYGWQEISANGITAHWTGEEPFFGEQVIEVAQDAVAKLSDLLPMDYLRPFDIYVYPSSADIASGLRLGSFLDSQESLSNQGVLLVTAVNPRSAEGELAQSVPPAVADYLLGQAFAGDSEAMPWWFRVGVAGQANPQMNPRSAELLSTALERDNTIPLWRLCQTPLEAGDGQALAAAQSVSLVDYLIRSRGEAAVSQLAEAYVSGDSCEAGVQNVLGVSLDRFDSDWKTDISPKTQAAEFWLTNGLWLVILLGGTVLAALLYWVSRTGEWMK